MSTGTRWVQPCRGSDLSNFTAKSDAYETDSLQHIPSHASMSAVLQPASAKLKKQRHPCQDPTLKRRSRRALQRHMEEQLDMCPVATPLLLCVPLFLTFLNLGWRVGPDRGAFVLLTFFSSAEADRSTASSQVHVACTAGRQYKHGGTMQHKKRCTHLVQ